MLVSLFTKTYRVPLAESSRTVDYRVYGKTYEEEIQILKDLEIIQDSGVFAVVIEATIESLVRKAIKKINTLIRPYALPIIECFGMTDEFL